MENETQGEDAITIFKKFYGNDPTARLWGYAGENVLDSGLFQYINTEGLGDKMTLLYVTSLQKEPVKQIRIKHINPLNGVSYAPPDDPANDATFHPVIDMGTKMNFGTDEPQNCDEGAPDYFGGSGWFPGFTVYKNCFIEYSHE